jgi:hypothetical protein
VALGRSIGAGAPRDSACSPRAAVESGQPKGQHDGSRLGEIKTPNSDARIRKHASQLKSDIPPRSNNSSHPEIYPPPLSVPFSDSSSAANLYPSPHHHHSPPQKTSPLFATAIDARQGFVSALIMRRAVPHKKYTATLFFIFFFSTRERRRGKETKQEIEVVWERDTKRNFRTNEVCVCKYTSTRKKVLHLDNCSRVYHQLRSIKNLPDRTTSDGPASPADGLLSTLLRPRCPRPAWKQGSAPPWRGTKVRAQTHNRSRSSCFCCCCCCFNFCRRSRLCRPWRRCRGRCLGSLWFTFRNRKRRAKGRSRTEGLEAARSDRDRQSASAKEGLSLGQQPVNHSKTTRLTVFLLLYLLLFFGKLWSGRSRLDEWGDKRTQTEAAGVL